MIWGACIEGRDRMDRSAEKACEINLSKILAGEDGRYDPVLKMSFAEDGTPRISLELRKEYAESLKQKRSGASTA